MTYAMVSDDVLLRLEDHGLSRDARLMYLEGLVHCATALTDGAIRVRLARISDAPDPEAAAGELVACGAWERQPTGFLVADYQEHNRSREEIELARAAASERKRRSRLHKLGDHSQCIQGRYCPDGHVTRDRTPTNLHSAPIRATKAKDGSGEVGSADARLGRASASPTRHEFSGDYPETPCGECESPPWAKVHQPKGLSKDVAQKAEWLLVQDIWRVEDIHNETWHGDLVHPQYGNGGCAAIRLGVHERRVWQVLVALDLLDPEKFYDSLASENLAFEWQENVFDGWGRGAIFTDDEITDTLNESLLAAIAASQTREMAE
jgi:hypothetical protein